MMETPHMNSCLFTICILLDFGFCSSNPYFSSRPVVNTLGGAVAAVALGYLLAHARRKFFPNPLAAAEQARLAAIHRIIREKGEAAKSMTLGEVAKELRVYGGMWPAMADYEGNHCMKSGYFMSHVQAEPKDAFAVGKGGMESDFVMSRAHEEPEEAVAA
ncbi:uncharacterized protein LOC111996635 [Quercus suber]|uniref:uncharacterized protein LOC111996635 n=1 Tax=Quercus suber TaxID=58331 RepID=UPI0032DE676B